MAAGRRAEQAGQMHHLHASGSTIRMHAWELGRETHAEAIDGEASVAAGRGTRFPLPPVSPPHLGNRGRARRAPEGGDVELHGEDEVGMAAKLGPGVGLRRHSDLIRGDPRPPPPPISEAIAIWKGFK
uniref:Uncharacterized protein n=1 Tax=Oryza punctata TaxID=4537 RepID=A0A0E0L983_ORYPU